jgi:tetratricopeptide (TPR) repeat protein
LLSFSWSTAEQRPVSSNVDTNESIHLAQCKIALARVLLALEHHVGNPYNVLDPVLLCEEVLQMCESGSKDHAVASRELGRALLARFIREKHRSDVERALAIQRRLLDTTELDQADRHLWLSDAASSLLNHFNSPADMEHIESSIEMCRESIALGPSNHPERDQPWHTLGRAYWLQYTATGDRHSLQESVDAYTSCLNLRSPGHPLRGVSLTVLGNTVGCWFDLTCDVCHLHEAQTFLRQAKQYYPSGHPENASALIALSITLVSQYNHTGLLADLNEAIEIAQLAMSSLPSGTPSLPRIMLNTAACLGMRFRRIGDVADLERTIQLLRQASTTSLASGFYGKYMLAWNLASSLALRYQQYEEGDDLAEAIDLYNTAFSHCPSDHPDRGYIAAFFSKALQLRFSRYGDQTSLHKAVHIAKQHAEHGDRRHTSFIECLIVLVSVLRDQYKCLDQPNDLDKALEHAQDALDICPRDYVTRHLFYIELGICHRTRYEGTLNIDDLSKALELHRAGLELIPPGHPDRPESLCSLALTHLQAGSPSENAFMAIETLKEALLDPNCLEQSRFANAIQVLEKIGQQVGDLHESAMANSLLDAHRIAINALPRGAFFGLDVRGRLRSLARTESLGATAAVLAALQGQAEEAIEILEQGRAVFWSQNLRLREDFTGLPSDMAIELKDIARQLQASGSFDSDSKAVREEDLAHRRRLGDRFESLVQAVQARPGWERFLRPRTFAWLAKAATVRNPLVVLLASRRGCLAIAITAFDRPAQVIPLPAITVERLEALSAALNKANWRGRTAIDNRGMRRSMYPPKSTRDTFCELWENVVVVIKDALGWTVSSTLPRCHDLVAHRGSCPRKQPAASGLACTYVRPERSRSCPSTPRVSIALGRASRSASQTMSCLHTHRLSLP